MTREVSMLVLLGAILGTHSVFAETPAKFQPFLGSWRYDSTAALRCPCTIEIRDVQANGLVVGSFYNAQGHDVLSEAKIAEKKNQMELMVTTTGGNQGWLALSQDRKHLSGLWEMHLRRMGGPRASRTSITTFEKVFPAQEPAATKQ